MSRWATWRNKKTEPITPHFLSLTEDIVVRSQKGKCGLKYVICIFALVELSLDYPSLYLSCAQLL